MWREDRPECGPRRSVSLFSFSTPTHIFRDPSLYQLSHQGNRQGPVRLKGDGALAGVVVLEFVLVSFHYSCTFEVGCTAWNLCGTGSKSARANSAVSQADSTRES